MAGRRGEHVRTLLESHERSEIDFDLLLDLLKACEIRFGEELDGFARCELGFAVLLQARKFLSRKESQDPSRKQNAEK